MIVYKYYFDKGHTFDEMENWTYEQYTTALAFAVFDLER